MKNSVEQITNCETQGKVKCKRNKLQGLDLKLVSIHRQTIENATPICCENCGKGIINFAIVTNNERNFYIGLDCKKTLIDSERLKNLTSDDFMEKYEAKEYRRELNEVNKFLLATSREGVEIQINEWNSLMVRDAEKMNQFGGKGVTIYMNNLAFLQKHGLTDYINTLISNVRNN